MLRSVNPATGEQFADYPEITAEEIETRIARSVAAFRAWREAKLADRSVLLRRIADQFDDNKDRLARTATLEMGKTLASAIAEVDVDHVATAAKLGPLLGRLAREPIARQASETELARRGDATDQLEREMGIASVDDDYHERAKRYGAPSRFSCPECGGVLWEVSIQGPLFFRCEVGHAHSAASLGESQMEVIEAAMWAALRALEDKVALSRRRAAIAESRGLGMLTDQFTVEEQAAQQHASALRALLRLSGRPGIRSEPGSHGGGQQRPERTAPNRPQADRGLAGGEDPVDSELGTDTAVK